LLLDRKGRKGKGPSLNPSKQRGKGGRGRRKQSGKGWRHRPYFTGRGAAANRGKRFTFKSWGETRLCVSRIAFQGGGRFEARFPGPHYIGGGVGPKRKACCEEKGRKDPLKLLRRGEENRGKKAARLTSHGGGGGRKKTTITEEKGKEYFVGNRGRAINQGGGTTSLRKNTEEGERTFPQENKGSADKGSGLGPLTFF